jgi:glycerophosphoryl diester phosphodiesterase
VLIYGHRGAPLAGVPENSMAAFRRMAAEGHGIETDLRLDSEGTIILFHDRVVGDTPVDRLTRRQLEDRIGYTVPTLDELLAAALSVPLNLEVKTRAAAAALVPLYPTLPSDVLVSSFIHDIAVKAAAYGLESAYVEASAPGTTRLPERGSRLATIVWDFNIVSDDLVAAATRGGFSSIVYGPRTRNEHVRLHRLGCRAIITDTPDLV